MLQELTHSSCPSKNHYGRGSRCPKLLEIVLCHFIVWNDARPSDFSQLWSSKNVQVSQSKYLCVVTSMVRVSDSVSLNAAVFAAVCLASRLPSSLDTFSLLLCAMELFVFFPDVRRTIKVLQCTYLILQIFSFAGFIFAFF